MSTLRSVILILAATLRPGANAIRMVSSIVHQGEDGERLSLNHTRELEVLRTSMQGQHLRGRYRLEEFLHSVEQSEHGPGLQWPNIKGFQDVSHISAGSFGDVWKARDLGNRGKEVAVKIFYDNCEPPCKKSYITRESLALKPDHSREIKSAVQECKLVQHMMRSKHLYLAGASRICKCIREHVSDAGPSDPLFVVQELCGRDLHHEIYERRIASRHHDIPGEKENARSLVFQMLQALAFLQLFEPPIIHRDLKLSNVCLADGSVKVIDWGFSLLADVASQNSGAAGTPGFAPPEARGHFAFASPWHSFDIYSVGIMYIQMLCPSMPQPNEWNRKIEYDERIIFEALQFSCPSINLTERAPDVKLIALMVAWDPNVRPSPSAILNSDEGMTLFPELRRAVKAQVGAAADPEDHRAVNMFPVGTEVEYLSVTYNVWVDTIVGGYSVSRNTYTLLHADGASLLKTDAPANRVRLKTDQLQVGDIVAYQSSIYGIQCAKISKIVFDSAGRASSYELVHPQTGDLFRKHADPAKVSPWTAQVTKDLQPALGKKEADNFNVGDVVSYFSSDDVILCQVIEMLPDGKLALESVQQVQNGFVRFVGVPSVLVAIHRP